MIPEIVREIAQRIGRFYLDKHAGDYEAATRELLQLQISAVRIDTGDRIIINTARPGMMIGRRGENIDKLNKFLGAKLYIVEDEDCLYNWLLPRKEEPLDYD